MAFTTWDAFRAEARERLQEHVEGEPLMGEFEIGDRRYAYKNVKELTDLYVRSFELESADIAAIMRGLVTYGRHRRFT